MAPSWYSTVMNDLDISTQQSSQYLTSRSIFTRDDDAVRDSKDCARPIPTLVGDPLYANSDITFHQLAIYICIPCLALTTISTLLLCWRHIKNYTAPQEQRQILRIAALPVFLCLFNFLALCWYGTFQYIQPLAGLYQAFAIAALFFLLLEWVCPEGTDREKYFSEFPFKGKKGVIIEGGSLAWFERTWAQIFQYPLITLVFTIIEIVTQYYGKYCSNSFAPKHAHLWLFLASIIFVAGALEATGAFARRMSSEMSGTHKERAKIYSFLGIFFFQIIQGIMFSLLNGKLFSPTRLLTYNDINFGMPAFLTCLETLLFSLIFHWAYSAREFQTRPHRFLEDQRAPRLGTWRAVRDALDLSDVVNAVWVALKFAWRGLKNWWNGSSTSRGPVGKVVDLLADAAAKRRDGRSGEDGESGRSQQGVSPFDDSMAVAGPAVPHAARDPAPPGRVRTFNGESALGFYGDGEYVPLRGNSSRDSSLSDRERSYSRR